MDSVRALDLATAEIACARGEPERLEKAWARCTRLRAQLATKKPETTTSSPRKEDSPKSPANEARRAVVPLEEKRAEEEKLVHEILEFLQDEPPAEQVRLVEYALEKKDDLPLVARAFAAKYESDYALHEAFDNDCLVATLETILRHAHVSLLSAPATLLRILVRRDANLRRALKCGATKTATTRLNSIRIIRRGPSGEDPLFDIKHHAVASLRSLVAALLWGRTTSR